MNEGKAVGIFLNIESDQFSDEEKGSAIMTVCGMKTHNGVTKAAMLRVIWWLLNLCFEVPEDGKEAEDAEEIEAEE